MLMVIFVVLMILALFGGCYGWRPQGPSPNYAPIGGWIILWLCVAILGWVVFNGPATMTTTVIR